MMTASAVAALFVQGRRSDWLGPVRGLLGVVWAMPRWDISPSRVQGVLGQTEAVAQEFEPQLRAMNSALQGAAGESSSQIVAGALSGFATESAGPALQSVFERTSACMSGAALATNAYVEGDLEMARNAQSAASAAPDPRASMPGPGGSG
jgi:hypothetical protein